VQVGVRSACRRAWYQARLDLAVAVVAEEHALTHLLEIGRQGLGRIHAERKGLFGGIDVVKPEVDDAPLISADRAPAARRLDESALDLLLATGNGFANASFAAPSPGALAGGVVGELR
jgi:hypothetical protein